MVRNVLRVLRVAIAALSLGAIVVGFVAPGIVLAGRLGWIVRLQLVPAIMAGTIVALIALVILVALFGRLYCSIVCPLGISQDLVRGLAKVCRVPSVRLRGGRTLGIVRASCLAVFLILCCVGFTGLFEPYGIFGRFLSTGVLRVGDPAVLVTVWSLALFVAIVGVGAFVPRLWCNAVCPVGTFLGLFSRFALFRVRIDAKACVKCGLCAKACEAGALEQGDDRMVKIDASRCVMCGNCLPACKKGAVRLFGSSGRVRSAE